MAPLAAVASARARADDEPPKDPARPITSSLPGVLERMHKEWEAPCEAARAQGLPCFPVWVEEEPAKPSKPEWLRDAKPPTAPVPKSAPTHAEMLEHLSGSAGLTPPLASFSFDPGCVGKGLLKKLKGKNDTYYLYRVTDHSGQRMALYDHLLNPASYQVVPGVKFELLGKFDGECDAVAAYLREVWRSKAEGGEAR